MKIVIIEDEKLTAKDLVKTIHSIDAEIEILAILSSVEDSIQFFKSIPEIDLIFSDIELGDGLSFEIFKSANINTPIIFCTAYNQYALEAFGTFGIDYILKPFTAESVEKALTKFQTIRSIKNTIQPNMTELISMLHSKLAPINQSIVIRKGDKIIPLDIESIALFYIENDVVFAHNFDGKRFIVSSKLDQLEANYSPKFFRANRQFLIHRKAVKDASQHFHRKLIVHLHIPFTEDILVGKMKVTEFIQWLATS